MKIREIIEEAHQSALKKGLAVLALASGLSFGASAGIGAYSTHENSKILATMPVDKELTRAGQEAIQNLPAPIRNKLGDISTIVFVSGVPPDGGENAVCQIEPGTRRIFVNPKYREQFLSNAEDQLTAHELTHLAQSNLSAKSGARIPKDTAEDNASAYGYTSSPDAWKILAKARQKGDRMWNHSREEQAMIVQQRITQNDDLQSYLKTNRTDDAIQQAIALQKQKLAIYDAYINDYDNM